MDEKKTKKPTKENRLAKNLKLNILRRKEQNKKRQEQTKDKDTQE